jgi:ribosomal protein S18 acetylase RimI-like enzyme
MSSELFATYIEEAVSHFSREYVISGICNEKDAVAICLATYERSLPLGVATPDNHLFTISMLEEKVIIGMAWLAVWKHSGKHSAFICDIYIRPEWRNRGYGTQTMQLLEKKIRGFKNVSEIGLHVLWQNKVAQSLYNKLGFKPTGINMIKHLDVENT